MLALTALSHIVFGCVGFLSMAVWALATPGEGRARCLARAGSIAAKAMLLLAWFVVPMMLVSGDINRSRWEAAVQARFLRRADHSERAFFRQAARFWPSPGAHADSRARRGARRVQNQGFACAAPARADCGMACAIFRPRDLGPSACCWPAVPADLPLHRLEAAFELFAILIAGWATRACTSRSRFARPAWRPLASERR